MSKKKSKNSTVKTWENEDGSFTAAIEIPMFLSDKKYALLFAMMARYIAQYIASENINSCKEFDKRDEDEQFHNKTIKTFIHLFGKTCLLDINVDMVESAQIIVDFIQNLKHFDRNWIDKIITPQTNFKYEWMPIYEGIMDIINNDIEEAAPLIKCYYANQKQASK